MNLQKIDLLIRKYEQGDTTLAEEEELKAFFAQKQVPEKYKIYRELFGYYDLAVKEEYPDPGFDDRFFENLGVSTGSKTGQMIPLSRRTWWSLAAAIAVLIGLYVVINSRQPANGTYNDPQLAYAETKKVLMMVSGNLNTGMTELSNIKSFDEGIDELKTMKTFNDGLRSMEKISTLDKTTNFIKQ